MKRLQKRKQLCSKVGDSSDISLFDYGKENGVIKTLFYSRGIQAALELVLKTSRTVKRMGIDTSPYCKIRI